MTPLPFSSALLMIHHLLLACPGCARVALIAIFRFQAARTCAISGAKPDWPPGLAVTCLPMVLLSRDSTRAFDSQCLSIPGSWFQLFVRSVLHELSRVSFYLSTFIVITTNTMQSQITSHKSRLISGIVFVPQSDLRILRVNFLPISDRQHFSPKFSRTRRFPISLQ